MTLFQIENLSLSSVTPLSVITQANRQVQVHYQQLCQLLSTATAYQSHTACQSCVQSTGTCILWPPETIQYFSNCCFPSILLMWYPQMWRFFCSHHQKFRSSWGQFFMCSNFWEWLEQQKSNPTNFEPMKIFTMKISMYTVTFWMASLGNYAVL